MRAFILVLVIASPFVARAQSLSDASQECLGCHAALHPGIVEGWRQSRHAHTTPDVARQAAPLARRLSATNVPADLSGMAVGCAECHLLRPDAHADTFDHNGYPVHVVVTPDDCAVCHPVEREQYRDNLMANAYGNLASNAVYQLLEQAIIGDAHLTNSQVTFSPADAQTKRQGCYYCHGTQITVSGMETRDNPLFGAAEYPVLTGWPNQGVGRVNPDGSLGSCTACHPRHAFSIAVARSPATCAECHDGPDVPAHKVYAASKHGNLYEAAHRHWTMDTVPWTVGKDFEAPTCATCHMSLLVNPDGEVLAERTHRIQDRLPWRLFGLPYAHPHPTVADTTVIRNQDGLPLPTDFAGGIATNHLATPAVQAERAATMQGVCLACHSSGWVKGHWDGMEATIRDTNQRTREATQLMDTIWQEGFAGGLAQGGNPFDEAIERQWLDVWLLHANSIRFTSAMGGGGDYAVFADGHYALSKDLTRLADWLSLRRAITSAGKTKE